jgi:CheY-like chemotaxis protein
MVQQLAGVFHAANKPWQEAGPLAVSSESEAAEPGARTRTILVVDDEKRIADTLGEILRAYDFEPTVAYDGWEALEALRHFRPDFILSDVLMPRMNGVELAIAAQNLCPSTKILLFSGQAGITEILESGKRRGFTFPVIAKPLHPLKLVQQLKEL